MPVEGRAPSGRSRKTEPDLCYGCHKRKDQSKSVHTAVRQGSCLSCHDPHSSNFPHQLNASPREKLCLDCHEIEPLHRQGGAATPRWPRGAASTATTPHGSDAAQHPSVGGGTAFCLKCHDAKAPAGKGTAERRTTASTSPRSRGPRRPSPQKNDCGVCHEIGHSGDNLQAAQEERRSTSATAATSARTRPSSPTPPSSSGDCAVCHDPHSSDQPKLPRQADQRGDLLRLPPGRPHRPPRHPHAHREGLRPVPRSARRRPTATLLKGGDGQDSLLRLPPAPVDGGKVKHAALERYGCTGLPRPARHRPTRFLVAKKVNDLCIGCHDGQKDGTPRHAARRRGHVVGGEPERPAPRRTATSPAPAATTRTAPTAPTSSTSAPRPWSRATAATATRAASTPSSRTSSRAPSEAPQRGGGRGGAPGAGGAGRRRLGGWQGGLRRRWLRRAGPATAARKRRGPIR
ncbi:MAG: cytochrome c3 family protein [Desulfomicrobium escambiense]|nr:cytochrome c3 family protein [Desulfomicrobium escambiense]